MTTEDYRRVLKWFADNGVMFFESSPTYDAHWFTPDGSIFSLSTIEACASFDEVRALVLGEVMAA